MDKVKEKENTDIVVPDEEKVTVPEGYTEEEWRDLSEAEREAIQSKDTEEKVEEKDELSEDQLKAIAGEEGKETEVVEEKKEGEEGKEEIVVVSDEDLLSFKPTIDKSKLPQPGEEVIPDEVKTKLADLQTRYDDGDIKLPEFIQERDVLNRQIVAHNSALNERAKEAAISELTWQAEQSAFFKARPEYEFKKDGSPKGKAMFGALTHLVRELDSDPANNGLSGMALLIKADKIVKSSFAVEKKEDKKEDKTKETNDKKKEVVKPPAKVPEDKTLAEIPASRENVIGSWATALDQLEGEAYEAALERLTPEQRDRYLSTK